MRRRRPGRWSRCPAESCGRCRRMRGWRLRRMNHRRRNRTGGCRARSCAPGSLGRGHAMGSRSPRRARKRSRSWPRCVDRRRRGLSTAIFPRSSALSDRRARQVMRRAGLRQRGSLPRGLRSGWRRVLRPGWRRVLRRGCEGGRCGEPCVRRRSHCANGRSRRVRRSQGTGRDAKPMRNPGRHARRRRAGPHRDGANRRARIGKTRGGYRSRMRCHGLRAAHDRSPHGRQRMLVCICADCRLLR
jgi:hypothetical protein